VDSRGYDVLNAEDVEELKKVCVLLDIKLCQLGTGVVESRAPPRLGVHGVVPITPFSEHDASNLQSH
jgi:hypothetical protein